MNISANNITHTIIGCALEVHKELGPGLLESAYEACMKYELENSGLIVAAQKPMPLTYKEIRMDCGYRTDLIVENKVIVEIKALEALHDIHLAQILTYMKLTQCHLGLLINFNVTRIKDGVKRVIL